MRTNREAMETAAVDAASRGMDRPLVLGLNAEDPTGKAIAAQLVGTDEVERRIRDCRANDMEAALVLPVTHDVAIRLLAHVDKGLQEFLDRDIPEDGYRFVIVTHEAFICSTATIPK